MIGFGEKFDYLGVTRGNISMKGLLYMILWCWGHDSMHLSKSIICTRERVDFTVLQIL